MTIITACRKSEDGNTEITIEWDKYDGLHAFVYEKVGGDWRETHRSCVTNDEKKVKAAFNRFVKKYLS